MQAKEIHVRARRWFDAVNGNTYHSVRVFVNDQLVAFEPLAYGYGEQYMETAATLLERLGTLERERYPSGVCERFRDAAERQGFELTSAVYEVKRQTDLHLDPLESEEDERRLEQGKVLVT